MCVSKAKPLFWAFFQRTNQSIALIAYHRSHTHTVFGGVSGELPAITIADSRVTSWVMLMATQAVGLDASKDATRSGDSGTVKVNSWHSESGYTHTHTHTHTHVLLDD